VHDVEMDSRSRGKGRARKELESQRGEAGKGINFHNALFLPE